MTLAEVEHGREVVITRIRGGGAIRQRLLDMGITRGTTVRVERHAPLGDPVEICVKGYCLALRKEEAAGITVEDPQDGGQSG
ncbi:MAG: FeoA family protein [Planctomycetota bacterium]|jgi:ferrous iron transport protein A